MPFDSDTLPPLPKILNRHHFAHGAAPPGAIDIGRVGKWGNPIPMKPNAPDKKAERLRVIAEHRVWLPTQPQLMAALHELEGRDLICWCAPAPCHGETLRWFANPSLRDRIDAEALAKLTLNDPNVGWQPPETVPVNGDEFYYFARGKVRVGSLGFDLGGPIARDPGMTAWCRKVFGDDPPPPPPANLKIVPPVPVLLGRRR